jgi:putative SOS response-associated peptidase YedK
MCVNYTPTRKDQLADQFHAMDRTGNEWESEIWQDYAAPFITHDALKRRQAQRGTYGLIPKAKLPPGKRFSTMNARAETIAELSSFARPWRTGQRCLIPMQHFYEPNYESGAAVRWQIGVEGCSDFAVAGLYKVWDEADGQASFSFTQITINADQHPLMQRFHRPGDEKRGLVIIAKQDYDDWLSCSNPEMARAFLQHYRANAMWAKAAPVVKRSRAKEVMVGEDEMEAPPAPIQATLF